MHAGFRGSFNICGHLEPKILGQEDFSKIPVAFSDLNFLYVAEILEGAGNSLLLFHPLDHKRLQETRDVVNKSLVSKNKSENESHLPSYGLHKRKRIEPTKLERGNVTNFVFLTMPGQYVVRTFRLFSSVLYVQRIL